MISLQITDVKDFMYKLLKTELFDNFLLSEAVITNTITYALDGHLNTAFFSEEELEDQGLKNLPATPYHLLRDTCFELIKGKKTPTFFKFVFMLSPENTKKTLAQTNSSFTENDIAGICINLRFQNQQLLCTTGVSYRIFSPDRSFEYEWDTLVQKFLKNHDVSYELVS